MTNKILKQIRGVDWQLLVSRREALLCRSIHDNALRNMKKATGIPRGFKLVLRFSDGEIYHSSTELDHINTYFSKSLFNVKSFAKRLVKEMTRYEAVAQEIARYDVRKMSQKELAALLKYFTSSAYFAPVFLSPMAAADRVLSQKILSMIPEEDPAKKQDMLQILCYPIKENLHTTEERSFLKMVQAYKSKDPRFVKLLEAHLEKYAWIGARGYRFEKVWTEADIESRIKSYISQNKNLTNDLRRLNKVKQDYEKKTAKLLARFRVKKDSDFYRLVYLAKEYAYLRTWRTDVVYKSGYDARNLLKQVVLRAGLKASDLVDCTIGEIEEMAKTGKPPFVLGELTKRRQFYATFYNNGDYRVIAGKKALRDFNFLKTKIQKVQVIQGITAFPGVVRGTVKIVHPGDDLNKVKVGDVLVATMTFPSFIAAMEKAAAFVTDEGGILCHAAIISREMKKPCVIATKNATQSLRDGDRVEVDANNGIIRKI